ncbi:NAD(P)/FAD-dependent oxidoreductase [Nocardioides sp.]|uniref:dihydrolipoyl dehydrogenase family protein n=1 Tax=Nocardioides sp. TaxID=35761 RepID=UPI003529C25B
MAEQRDVDVVVIGLGPGGEYAANKLAAAGLRVVGVEKHLVGGECPFYGCIPSKLWIRGSDLVGEARRADALAGPTTVTPEWRRVEHRIRDEATNDWSDDGHVAGLVEAGVEVVRGHARLEGPGRVVVEGPGAGVYTAARGVVLNTGTDPAELPIDGLAETPAWTNREVFKIQELPASVAVIGGGPIGCELAQALRRFGTEVTLLEVADRLMTVEEPETSALMARVFRGEGIDVRTGVTIDRVDHADDRFTLTVDGEQLEADRLLVAAGRRANLADVGLETVGLDPSARTIATDERMRAAERLWAVGDITGHGAFTHVSMYQAAVAVRDLLGEDGPWADYRAVSRVTFTDPEVGSVGMTEQQAREAGLSVRTATSDLPRSSRGWLHGAGNDGLIKLVADADRGILVGATSAGPSGGEVLSMLATAVHAEVPLDTLRTMHFAYPTFHRAVEVALKAL